MRGINAREAMTPREREEFAQEKEIASLQAEYQVRYKEMELELKRIETKWTQVFRLPFAIILLPVRLILTLGYVAHAIRGTQPDQRFWDLLTKM